MIQSDQPVCFPSSVTVAVSSKADGTMLDRVAGVHARLAVDNRRRFCRQSNLDYQDVVYQRIVYDDTRTYELICEVDSGSSVRHTSEIVADALITRVKGVVLMLPVADCVATVMYDPRTETLAMVHLGRHSTVTSLLARVIDQMTPRGARAQDIIVWMSPNAHKSHYVMQYFDYDESLEWQDFCSREPDGYHLDLQGYNARVCLSRGIQPQNIHMSSVNTVTSTEYFSHSAGDVSGRFAVVATMRP